MNGFRWERLERLCGLRGISGQEDAVRKVIEQEASPFCGCRTDRLGNLICFKKGRERPKQTILFSAHMDEVGFIVTHISEEGRLGFAPVGGIDSRVVYGKPVLVGENALPGVIAGKALHQLSGEERDKPAKLENLSIDIGASSRAEAQAMVCLGDQVTFRSRFSFLGEEALMGKALDDRAGCALLLEMMERDLPFDCHFVFTVREEVGGPGAGPAARAVGAGLAVIVENTTAGDVAGAGEDEFVCRQGGGPVVSFMDRGTVYDHHLYRMAFDAAEKKGIPCQTKHGVFGGNESRAVQAAGEGVRVAAVSLPARYIHSPAATLRRDDISHSLLLLEAMLERMGRL